VSNILKGLNIDIQNCRGKWYDNDANMLGVYTKA